MKFFLFLVVLAVVAVNADEKVVENQEAEASQSLPSILPSQKPLRPKPTLAPYKPTLKVLKPIQTTRAPILPAKVVPTAPRKNIIIKPTQSDAQNSGAYVPWSA